MKLRLIIIGLLLTGAVQAKQTNKMNQKNTEIATLGSGCFWCTEAIFQELKGVEKVESGYMGGELKIQHIKISVQVKQDMQKYVKLLLILK